VARSLGTDLIGISWALLSYQLSAIGLSIIFGRLADLWGREKIFAGGFMMFALSSLLCGLSQSASQLIGFRFIEGVGGAMVQSSGRALASEAVPEEMGGRAQGFMTIAHHIGFLLGPGIGGVMIDYFNWRWSFFFLTPIGLLGALVTLVNIVRRPRQAPRKKRVAVDYLGAVLLIATTTSLVVIFDRRTLQMIGGNTKLALIALFFCCLGALLLHETRTQTPFIDLSLFRSRRFSFSVLSLLIIAICYALTGFLVPFYLQGILGLSASVAGFLFMTPSVLTIALAPLSGYFADRLGPRVPATIGAAFMVASLGIGGFLRIDSHWALAALLVVFVAITNGVFNPANSLAMIGMMPKEHRGFASAMNYVTFGIGNVLGVAVGSFSMAYAFEYHTGLVGVSPTTDNPAGFVAAFNTTFLAAAALSLAAVATSLARGGEKVESVRSFSLT
jgi:EmrB/QacA subfamily drug resistance transporter